MPGHYEPRFGAVMPKMDLREEEDRFLVSVELPKTPEAKKAHRKVPIQVSGKVKKLEKKAA